MANTNKLYSKFLIAVAEDTNKDMIIKKFNKIFKNVRFTHEDDEFNQNFLEGLFKRKNIKWATSVPSGKRLHSGRILSIC